GGGDPASALRHVYLIPVAALALAFGRLGGTLGAGATLVLYASVVLPALERSGLTPETMEGPVTFALVGGVGALGGTLTTRARRRAGRRARRRGARGARGARRPRRRRAGERAAHVAGPAVRRRAGGAGRDRHAPSRRAGPREVRFCRRRLARAPDAAHGAPG